MPSKDITRVFDAEAESLHSLFMSEGGVAGFRIPIYQRTYDWDRKNIQRFFEDALSGMMWLASDPDSLTFIGTIIFVVEETKKEKENFHGSSLSVIDGQQRLTTIALIACVLYEEITSVVASLPQLANDVKIWIKQESNYAKGRLLTCVFGHLPVDGINTFPFPRIVREQIDCRGNNPSDSEYRSVIASYLNDFAQHIREKNKSRFEYHPQSQTPEVERFLKNVESIAEFLEFIRGDGDSSNADISASLPSAEVFVRQGYRKLFYQLPTEQPKADKIVSTICHEKDGVTLGCVRLITFATYLMDRVIATRVKTGSEKYAFDIFDALNTTGEPLTAVETFRPHVIKFEKALKGYPGSPSEREMQDVEQYLGQFKTSDARQKEAKDLIVPFALYVTGETISRNLSDQRRYLRSKFDEITGNSEIEGRRHFVCHLAEIATYKVQFWSKNLVAQLPTSPESELILVCLQFLKDLDNSLTIPVLCRYYTESQKEGNEQLFADAVKALTAFIVLRRSVTGGTAGIDTDLRGLMSSGPRKKTAAAPLCAGLQTPKKLVRIEELREYLLDWLSAPRIGIDSKNCWVQKVSVQPLYLHSTPLCRFLLLAAAHNARPDKNEPWKLVKVKESLELDYLCYQRWTSTELATVEHVAPDSPPSSGWDESIYAQPYLKDCVGNLTLLPKEENSAVGNASWLKKKKFYQAFAAETTEDVEKIISEAEKAGVSFGMKTAEMLKGRRQLPIAKTIAASDQWKREVIEKRSKNLAELVWDEIEPWLFRS